MKKCAIINDLSGFGKCSLTAAIPIISVMGCEAHPLPTVVLSNQTAFDSFSSHSLTDIMPDFVNEWKKLGASFDAILTGFFDDTGQIDVADKFIRDFKNKNTVVIVDPVMADNGLLYDGYSNEICEKIKALCYKADIITPNLSELAIIAEEKPTNNLDDIIRYGNKLINKGIKRIVATGYIDGDKISNIVFENGEVKIVSAVHQGGYYSGTGDILASIITGGIMRGLSLYDATSLATSFIEKVITNTNVENHNEGIEFERFLGELII